MFKLVVILSVAAVVMAAPQGQRGGFFNRGFGPSGVFVPIVRQNYDLNPVDNSYTFNYESADGSARAENGFTKNPGTPIEALSVSGSYNYVDTNGQLVTVNYIADENGFQPIGNVIHPAITKAVQDQVARARALPPYVYNPRQF